MGEKLEFNTEENALAFNPGRDLEYYSVIRANKDYVIYTNQRSGELSFIGMHQSIYSDRNMSIPTLTYDMGAGDTYTATHTFTSTSGYALNYNFHFEYYEDTTLQPVNVYYDLNGGVNHPLNYHKELASETTDLALYAPTREGYVFDGWYLDLGGDIQKLTKKGEVYCLDWEDICHMGETPDLYASSYYKKYYSNTNVAFVYASWIEAEYYDVEAEVVGGGTATPSGSTSITPYDTLTYTFTPDEGYQIKDVKINGQSVGAVSSYTFQDVWSAQTLCVEFEKIQYAVNVVCGEGGTVSGAADSVEHGDGITLTILPNENFAVTTIKVNGVEQAATETLNVENITNDTLIEISFKRVVFTITTASTGGGSITPTFAVGIGEKAVISLLADEDWQVASVYVNGEQVNAINNQVLLENVQGDMQVLVVFEEIESSVGFIAAIAAASSVALVSTLILIIGSIRRRKKTMVIELDVELGE